MRIDERPMFGDFERQRALVIIAVASFIGVVVLACNRLDTPEWPLQDYPHIGFGSPLIMFAQAAWASYRRERLSDLETFALLAMGPVLIADAAYWLIKPGSPLPAEWMVFVSGVLAAVLCHRLLYVVLVALEVTASMVFVIFHRLGPDAQMITAVFEGTTVLSVLFAIAAMRRALVTALVRLSRSEVTDPLTGLSNRRGLERYGPAVCRTQAVEHGPIALLVVDIDHFKKINDTLGHAAGDEVLRRVAQVISASTRPGDCAVRLGGEEFLLLLPASPGGAAVVAERLRTRIAEELGSVTVSVGVLEVVPTEKDPLPEVLWTWVESADQALYEAKRTGRNRVVLAA